MASLGWNLQHTYETLPASFHARVDPTPVRAPRLRLLNRRLAAELGLDPDWLTGEAGAAVFSGNRLPEGARPLAQAYAGHQFGHFAMLGDGRAILLGEQQTPDGRRLDIQLKGSGRTPFSRSGDGRAALEPMLREYLISEAMHGLGIPTTRSLAVVETGEPVWREQARQGAVLTRVAAGHIRVGTFQYAAARQDPEALRALADYTLDRHYPELADRADRYPALLAAVIDRQAALVAQWLNVGFIHGVMNTDNMTLSGETIDYGPCAFLDAYRPGTVFSSIDHQGRYAYGNQPGMAQWNLARLAESMLPLLADREEAALELATAAIRGFGDRFHDCWLEGMRRKLGLFTAEDGDDALAREWLELMQRHQADFSVSFRALATGDLPDTALFRDDAFLSWWETRRARLARQPQATAEVRARMLGANPALIPRNHQVEAALAAAAEGRDAPLHRLLAALANPYETVAEYADLASPPDTPDPSYRTYCGT